MLEAQNNVVSIETFRATRTSARPAATVVWAQAGAPRPPSSRNIEHRERMLQFLRTAARERTNLTHPEEAQGRLLL